MISPTPESAVRAAVRAALGSGVNGTQVLTWVMEETANEVDYMKEESWKDRVPVKDLSFGKG